MSNEEKIIRQENIIADLKTELSEEKKNSRLKKSNFEGFKRTNLSKEEIKKLNACIDRELKATDEALENCDFESEDYGIYLQRRTDLMNLKLEKEPNKIVEYLLRYGLPVLGGVVITAKYYSMQDPSQEGRTWFQALKDLFRFRN